VPERHEVHLVVLPPVQLLQGDEQGEHTPDCATVPAGQAVRHWPLYSRLAPVDGHEVHEDDEAEEHVRQEDEQGVHVPADESAKVLEGHDEAATHDEPDRNEPVVQVRQVDAVTLQEAQEPLQVRQSCPLV